jgi:hypothetical protein
LVLLAALGGCTSTGQDSDAGKKVTYDYRQQVPRSSDPSSMQNNRNLAYMNGQAAPYTRIGPSGAAPEGATAASQGTTTASQAATTASQAALTPPSAQVASAQKTPAPQAPTMLPTLDGDQTNNLTKAAPAPAPPAVKTATDKVINDSDISADTAALKNTIAATIARSDAKTAEILNGASTAGPPLPGKPKDMSSALASTSQPADMVLTSGYLPSRVPDTLEGRGGVPGIRVVNNKRITLNYKINDVGPSGVSGIDVWVTHDSRVWKKLDIGTQTHPPCVVEVSDEGLYGFTLVAKNGLGLSKAPPQPGDVPQVWVEVDLTRPVVHLLGVDTIPSGQPTVAIRWNASDKNLGAKPISLSYTETAKNAWKPIATGVDNNGRYVWQVPPNLASRFLIRVEATDLAGNIGMIQTQEPVVMDLSQPTISILNVESGGK